MHSNNSLILIKSSMLFLLPLFLFTSSYLAEAGHPVPDCDCTDTATFTRNSMFEAHLKSFLSLLYPNSTSNKYGLFYGFEIGNAAYPGDNLYGLFQCRVNLNNQVCNNCIAQAIKFMVKVCPWKKNATVSYDECLLSYSYEDFLNATGFPIPVLRSVSSLPPVNAAKPRVPHAISISAAVAGCVILSCIGYWLMRRREKMNHGSVPQREDGSQITTVESLQFDLVTIEAATKKFSTDNKLGRGGFGEVYKGTLPNGEEIAVKRLSRSSAQGAEEFKNEVLLVAKLQHRNLVRLLGFCLEGGEKILIYEYVPNRSLDYFLFDPNMQGRLGWSTRQNIIGGIARGILYLHEDSRLRIIHRDLKAGNILLDGDMNPKISDFGMAMLFKDDQTEGNTSRIVGTYGYMSPEYAMHGQFSVKSDVYSFGVLLLEIVSGKKNKSFYMTEDAEHLVSYVWKLWRDGRPLEAFDPNLTVMLSTIEVIRCLQIGLLCVQEDPTERPTMATVVLMLNSNSMDLPLPKRPAFFMHGRVERSMEGMELDQSRDRLDPVSVDEGPITVVSPR